MSLGPASREFYLCAVGGCGSRAKARGLCPRHYHRAYKKGLFDVRAYRRPKARRVRLRFYTLEGDERAVLKLSRITGKTVSQILRDMLSKELVAAGLR